MYRLSASNIPVLVVKSLMVCKSYENVGNFQLTALLTLEALIWYQIFPYFAIFMIDFQLFTKNNNNKKFPKQDFCDARGDEKQVFFWRGLNNNLVDPHVII